MKSLRAVFDVITGKAVVICKRADNKADVIVGKKLSKKFVVSSLVGTTSQLLTQE